MGNGPALHKYWFVATRGLGIGVTAPDAGTAYFAARAALHRLPPGTTLTGQYTEDIDPQSLDLGDITADLTELGVWFPPGDVRPVRIRIARTNDEARADFVFVSDDGSARELTAGEAELLATSFYADDGARPYVKPHYDSRTPDGRLRGFLRRSELPAHTECRAALRSD